MRRLYTKAARRHATHSAREHATMTKTRKQTKIALLTGYLGAGKTTLLNTSSKTRRASAPPSSSTTSARSTWTPRSSRRAGSPK